MSRFPITTTTYNLVAEYCTIHRLIQYQHSYDDAKADRKPTFDTRAFEKLIYQCCLEMGEEIETIATGEYVFMKKDLANLLLSFSNEERFTHFKVSMIIMVEDFNKMFKNTPIGKSDAYDDFMKDGFILTGHFLSNVNYYLNKLFSKEVEIINKPKVETKKAESIAAPKIKMKMNIDRFAYLIRLMQEDDLFDYPSKSEVARQIIKHFSTIGTEDIGETSMINKLSETNKDEAKELQKLLRKWRDKAAKV